MRHNIATVKTNVFDGLLKLWRWSEGFNLYVADTAATELQCQLSCHILHRITLLHCRQESTLSHALRNCGLSEEASNCALAAGLSQVQAVCKDMSSPTLESSTDSGVRHECSEEFWDVDLDPNPSLRKPITPRFPMPGPNPVYPYHAEEESQNLEDSCKPPRKRKDFIITPGNPKKVILSHLNFKVSVGIRCTLLTNC